MTEIGGGNVPAVAPIKPTAQELRAQLRHEQPFARQLRAAVEQRAQLRDPKITLTELPCDLDRMLLLHAALFGAALGDASSPFQRVALLVSISLEDGSFKIFDVHPSPYPPIRSTGAKAPGPVQDAPAPRLRRDAQAERTPRQARPKRVRPSGKEMKASRSWRVFKKLGETDSDLQIAVKRAAYLALQIAAPTNLSAATFDCFEERAKGGALATVKVSGLPRGDARVRVPVDLKGNVLAGSVLPSHGL